MRELVKGIRVLDGFLSEDECARILDELECTLWRPSLTYEHQADDSYKNVLTDVRRSDTAHYDWFSEPLLEHLRDVEARLSAIAGIDPGRLEWWQATRYPVGGTFDYHLDAGYWDQHYAGDRTVTFLIYLDTPASGGETHFRALDVAVKAEAGRLLMWDNLFADGTPNHRMIHSGTPVRDGNKTTLVTWERQRPFRVVESDRKDDTRERTGPPTQDRGPDQEPVRPDDRSRSVADGDHRDPPELR